MLTKYRKNNPFPSLDIFRDLESMIMPLSFYSDEHSINATYIPKANVYYKDDKGYSIELAVPGYSREDFEIGVENGVVTVGMNGKVTDTEQEYQTIRRREWSYSNFKRSFTLPENVNVEQISASYEAGILNVTIPVESERNTKRIIEIQ